MARITLRRPAPVAALAALALLSGCGARDTGSTHQLSSTPDASGARSPVAYAKCMRSHGVPRFPDPNSTGGFNANGPGVDPRAPQYQAAAKACMSLMPAGKAISTQGAGAVSPQRQAQLLRFARCLRSHGEPKFPDPTGNGIALSNAIDRSSPQFQSAQQTCHSLLPGLGQGAVSTVNPGSGGGS
jgi:hypothetical protein